MTMYTAGANKAFLPEAIHDLIVQPVTTESVALDVANTINAEGHVNVYRVPIIASDPTAEWTAEGDEITASDAGLDEAASPFFKLAALTVITRELAEDSSPQAADIVGQGIARDLAKKLDSAFFGTHVTAAGPPVVTNDDQPAGLEDLTGFNPVNAGASWGNTDPFAEATYAAEGVGATLGAFVANPADALLLAKVKKATGSNEPLLGNDPTQPTRRVLAGIPLRVSPAVSPGTIWGIPHTRTLVALREDVNLQIDHSAFFTSDRVAIRATLRVAFLFPHAAAVQKITLTS